jgi:hypothetical protein
MKLWNEGSSGSEWGGIACCHTVKTKHQTLPAVAKGLAHILEDKAHTESKVNKLIIN